MFVCVCVCVAEGGWGGVGKRITALSLALCTRHPAVKLKDHRGQRSQPETLLAVNKTRRSRPPLLEGQDV